MRFIEFSFAFSFSTTVKNVFHPGKKCFSPGWKTFLTWVKQWIQSLLMIKCSLSSEGMHDNLFSTADIHLTQLNT
jgi:hypothetical protein